MIGILRILNTRLVTCVRLNGFVTDLYQCSHHIAFVNGRQLSLGDWGCVERDEYNKVCMELKKELYKIYPVKFECALTHWKRKISGILSVSQV